jgi:hypothetical protein
MSSEDITIALHMQARDLASVRREAPTLQESSNAQAKTLDATELEIDSLLRELNIGSPYAENSSAEVVERPAVISSANFTEIAKEAREKLAADQVKVSSLQIDGLLPEDKSRRIESQFEVGFTVQCTLDRYDIAFLSLAGLAAALVDFLLVRIPKDLTMLGAQGPKGSPLTKWLHSFNVPADNWLARHFKTSYDRVSDVASQIPGFSPTSHRLQTFAHDPFIGLVVGVIDIMRGGLSAVSKNGELIFLSGLGEPVYNPLQACVWHLMHLLSDAPTSMGLPPPGWSLLQLFQVGSFGDKQRTVGDFSRAMYRGGYDLRHCLTMATSVASAEITLRGYFLMRQKLDPGYAEMTQREAKLAGATTLSEHPRYMLMALLTHGIASAANAGKIVCYSGNPLAFNYPQWLWFSKSLIGWMRSKTVRPSDNLIRGVKANAVLLSDNWPPLDMSDPAFPTLVDSAKPPE